MVDKILQLDRELFLALNFDGGWLLDNIMWYFSWIGSYIIMVIFFLVMLRYKQQISYKRLLLIVLFMGLIILCADQTANFFKANLPKFRPSHTPELVGQIHTVRDYFGGLYGTVSGHSANGFGLAMFMSLLYCRRWFSWLVFIYMAIIAYSRIYLSAHFPLDIMFGTLFGLLYGFLIFKLYNYISYERNKRTCSR